MKKNKGFLLVGVMFAFLFMIIIVPVMVKWLQDDMKISVKDQKSGMAFALAEAAVDRGYWKVKGSTSTFAAVQAGSTMPGYRFDSAYTDITGGVYRVSVTSGPGVDQVTVVGEGRDSQNRETRAVEAIFTNTTVPGAILARGALNIDDSSVVHWGPVMSMANITVAGDARYTGYPRKLSRQAVLPSALFDSTGDTNPPNTDSLEWWSNYNVPELPIFDFETMRASAAATSTLNCQTVDITTTTYTSSTFSNPCSGSGCSDPGSNCTCSGSGFVGSGCTDTGGSCGCTLYTIGPACVDSGGSCSCSGSGAGRECTTSNYKNSGNPAGQCTDSDGAGTGCTLTVICTGSGCADSGANCDAGKLCRGVGCADSGANCGCNSTVSVTTTTTTTTEFRCCSSSYYGGPVTCNYPAGLGRDSSCVNCTVDDIYNQTTLRDKDYTWYWDQNTTWTGYIGIRGTVVVRGDFELASGGDDRYCKAMPGATCTVPVPPQAWREYQKYDTSAVGEYPGDLGLSTNSLTYTFGSNDPGTCSTSLPNDGGLNLKTKGELWRVNCSGLGLGSDLGVYGFLYVGGDLTRYGSSDIYGAMWVEGAVSGGDNTMVFYNSQLKLPTLNVVLQRDSWKEVRPATSAW